MLHKYYIESYIHNPGEAKVNHLFDEDFVYDEDHNWYVFHSFPIAKHQRKHQGEVDFMVVCQRGVLVIEVKGGTVHYKEGQFSFPATKYKPEKIFKESPFEQADGSKFSIINFLKEKGVKDCFTQSAVVFPESTFDYSGLSFDNFWHLNSELSFYAFINRCFDEGRGFFRDKFMDDEELKELVELLNPTLTPDHAHSRIKENLANIKADRETNTMILRGLYDNPRLLIQGPPGSGKSTYGLEYAENKLREGKKGLYLTYNVLLTDELRRKFSHHEQLDVYSLFEFYRSELELAGIDFPEEEYREIETLFLTIDSLADVYDFIVVDEAQDLFGDQLLKILNESFSHTNVGIEDGEYLVLYDRAQAFDKDRMHCLEKISPHAAKFNLLKNFRAAGSDELAGFIDECFQGRLNFDRDYQDIDIIKYNSYSEITSLLFKHITNQVSDGVFTFSEMVILCTTDMIRSSKEEVDLEKVFKSHEDMFSYLSDSTEVKKNTIPVTTALKYKGLERPVVYLLTNNLYDRYHRSFVQFLVGISRAQSKLVILVNDKN